MAPYETLACDEKKPLISAGLLLLLLLRLGSPPVEPLYTLHPSSASDIRAALSLPLLSCASQLRLLQHSSQLVVLPCMPPDLSYSGCVSLSLLALSGSLSAQCHCLLRCASWDADDEDDDACLESVCACDVTNDTHWS
jgi:hypothetical protein